MKQLLLIVVASTLLRAGCELKFGDDIENIVFYFVFGLFKISVIVQQIYFRYEKGLTNDIRFKNLNIVVQSYARMAKESIENEKIEF